MSDLTGFTFNDCVAELTTPRGLRNRTHMSKVLQEPGNLQRIWELVRDGVEMDFAASNHIRAAIERSHHTLLAANFWEGDHWFEDDDHFTNAKFYLITTTWSHRTPTNRAFMKARKQAQRMLAVGRANVIQVDRVAGEVSADDYTTVLMNAHSRSRRDKLRSEIQGWQNVNLRDSSHAENLERARTAMRKATELRLDLFITRWLPAQISTEEYGQVKDLQPSMLCNLYPDAWKRGYEAYQEQVTG